MKKAKRLLALGAAAMMLVGAVSLPVYARGNNDTPSSWSFEVGPGSPYMITKDRPKLDDSGTYIYYRSGNKPYFGCDVLNINNKSQCKKYGSINVGKKGRIAQYVYENGYRDCKLMLTSDNLSYGGGGGEWSPDSINSYPYINT